jgi:hypothetical protein
MCTAAHLWFVHRCFITPMSADCFCHWTVSKDMTALADTYIEWGRSFNPIHAAAALVKCSKLPGGGRSSLVDKLCSTWLGQLSMSQLKQSTNVLWACVKLGPTVVQRLWGPTWGVYIEQLQRESSVEGACVPQNVSNPLWACAKVRKQPSVDELQLMVQTFLQPQMLAAAKPQELANVLWALAELCRLPGWQGGVSEQDMQQLLGKRQLQLLAADDGCQPTSNVLVGLASMVTGPAPLVATAFARDCGKQLLALTGDRLLKTNAQHITNAIWACGELKLAETPFVAAAVAAAPRWVQLPMRLVWLKLP